MLDELCPCRRSWLWTSNAWFLGFLGLVWLCLWSCRCRRGVGARAPNRRWLRLLRAGGGAGRALAGGVRVSPPSPARLWCIAFRRRRAGLGGCNACASGKCNCDECRKNIGHDSSCSVVCALTDTSQNGRKLQVAASCLTGGRMPQLRRTAWIRSQGRTALVTGGSRGSASARAYARVRRLQSPPRSRSADDSKPRGAHHEVHDVEVSVTRWI